jgi:hypothetical protein
MRITTNSVTHVHG